MVRFGRSHANILTISELGTDAHMKSKAPFAVREADLVTSFAEAHRSEWRMLRRLHLPDSFNEPEGELTRRAVVIDVETTGLDLETGEVIQLAMLPLDYEVTTGRILAVYKERALESLRDPSVPIPGEITLLTGITDDMVAGRQIDGKEIQQVIEQVDLVIAHNARFDRPMVEKYWPCFADKPWACTLDCVDWLHEGFTAGELDYLGMQFGWFYDGHTALADCEACLALLAQAAPGAHCTSLPSLRRCDQLRNRKVQLHPL